MKFNRKLYAKAKAYPSVFKALTGLTTAQFDAISAACSYNDIVQGAKNTGAHGDFKNEHLIYYMMMLNHGISCSCIEELAAVSRGDAGRMTHRFAKFCGACPDISTQSERLELRRRFVDTYYQMEGRLPHGGVPSVDYLAILVPESLQPQFEVILDPAKAVSAATKVQAIFRGYAVRKAAEAKAEEEAPDPA